MRVFALVLLFSWALAAQGQYATLNGVITDKTGAVIPGVPVRAVNADTGEHHEATSSVAGFYTIPLIKPGVYHVTATAPGFRQYTLTGVTLETGAQSRIDIRLELGEMAERITVTATPPLIDSESAAVVAVVDNRTIVNMPLIDRRAAQLVKLSGFVVQTGTGSAFTAAGGRGRNAVWSIDGGNAQNVTLGFAGLSFDPPIEALQEFNFSIGNYAAELGRTGGAVIQMTTKSGTNNFHGSLYEFLRNDKFDARNFFSADKPKLRYNLFGGSIGGPIRKDRTHFFYNFESNPSRTEQTLIYNIPSPAEVKGDFSASTTVVRDPAVPGRPPFPGNVIPSSRLDPVGVAIAALYPAPNVAGRASGSSNFISNGAVHSNPLVHVVRVDHVFSDTDRMYARMLVSSNRTDNLPVFPTAGVDEFHRRRDNGYFSVSGTWFHSFTPTTINEFRTGMDRRKFNDHGGGFGLGLAERLGVRGTNPAFFPRVVVAGFTGLGAQTGHERLQEPIRNAQLIDHVTHIRGNHRIKFGYEFRYASNDDLNRNRAGGEFRFNNVATGNSLASLLLGWVQGGLRTETLLLRSRANAMGVFIQDDWKLTPNFTLNLGLRWDLDQPRWEQTASRQNSFDRFATNPVSGTPGVVTFSGRNGLSRYAHNYDPNNFGPRVGFAWRIGQHWVVRGGGALIYTPQYDGSVAFVANLGFSIQGDFVSPDNGLTPAFLLRDGLPAIREPTEGDLTPGFGAVRVGQNPRASVTFLEPGNRRNGYLETFNFNVQREFAGTLLVEVGYLGTLGHKLSAPDSQGINQVPPDRMGAGNAQIRRPFPQFSDVRVLSPAIGNSNYHGVNLKVQKRYSSGLHLQANYTWSRLIDDVESLAELGGNPGSAFSNFYDRRADRGVSGNHISHRLVWSSVYELPVGLGRAISIENRVLRQLFSGWAIGLIAELRTGSPYGVIELVNRTNAYSDSQRPNVVGSAVLSRERPRGEKVEQWFSTAAFAQPEQFTFGNAGRTSGYGPGAISMDLSMLKDFSVREGHRLQFRTEMLNFINNPNFGLPELRRGSPAFGRITTLIEGNQARIIQFGLHYRF